MVCRCLAVSRRSTLRRRKPQHPGDSGQRLRDDPSWRSGSRTTDSQDRSDPQNVYQSVSFEPSVPFHRELASGMHGIFRSHRNKVVFCYKAAIVL